MLLATLREGEPAPAPSAVRVASAKPFVPAIAGRGGVLRDVPIPPDRPYSLGDGKPYNSLGTARSAGPLVRAPPIDQAKQAATAAANGPATTVSRAAPPIAAYLPAQDIERHDLAPPVPQMAPAMMLRGVY
jgi:rare lipoprotein A